MKHVKFLIIFFIIITAISIEKVFADSEDSKIRLSIEVSSIGLELTNNSLNSNDFENAKKYSDFTSDFFAKNIQILRKADAQKTDEIHLMLLDLHTRINSNVASSSDILKIQNILKEFPIAQPSPESVIVGILDIADEQYQISIQENEDSSYQISKHLIQKARDLLVETDFNERQKSEIESFFNELNEETEDKSEFVRIGNLITAIQKDVLGSESSTLNHGELYQKIYALYDEMLVLVDEDDYTSAEEKAITAYLDNFEYLEPAIERADKDLLHKLELNMRENLRKMIVDKIPPNDIRSFVEDELLPDIHLSESLLPEQTTPSIISLNEQTMISNGQKKMGDSSEQEKSQVRNEVDFIRNSLLDVMIYYEEGNYQLAYTTARTAYLDSYEFVEIPLREIAPDFTLEVEYKFADLRKLIDERASVDQVREVVISINRNLDESERLVSGTGTLAPSIAFVSSFSIIFREGLESVLILGAIVTYLEASRNSQLKKYVYYGIVAAFGATAITWVIAEYIIGISGANRELVEAIAALSATAVLFYVSFWVLNKIEHKKWMEFVKAKVWQATTTGSVMVFVMLSFFTVYREGFETVLFYQAMSGFAKYMEVYVGLGFVVGIVSLLGLYYFMKKIGRRLPLRALFGLTMGVGAYLSIAFLGNAIRELQILDIVPYTSMIGTIPRLDINLAKMTGIYPTMETLIAQIILLGVYLAASSYVLIMRPRKERHIASLRKSRVITDAT